MSCPFAPNQPAGETCVGATPIGPPYAGPIQMPNAGLTCKTVTGPGGFPFVRCDNYTPQFASASNIYRDDGMSLYANTSQISKGAIGPIGADDLASGGTSMVVKPQLPKSRAKTNDWVWVVILCVVIVSLAIAVYLGAGFGH